MRKILVVVDMQKDFIDGALGTKEAQAIVPAVTEKIKMYRAEGASVYFTKDTHGPDYLSTQEGKNLPVAHCIKGTDGWALENKIGELAQGNDAMIFEKGIFGSEKLGELIRSRSGDEEAVAIELVGLCTDICVLSNAILLKTYMPEAMITVDAACCAGVTPETHHNALEAMKMCQVQVINQ